MRYLNWEVHMYGRDSNPSPEERQRLQSRLDEWYAECPPGTDKGGSYFDWYYHAIRASLYRPRATAMGMSSEHLLILKDSASKAMRICATLRRQRRLTDVSAYTWGTLTSELLLFQPDHRDRRLTPVCALSHGPESE